MDIASWLSVVTMDAILRTLFSTAADDSATGTAAAVQVLGAAALREMLQPLTLPDWLPLPGKAAKRRALAHLRRLIAGHVAARRGSRPGTDGPQDLLALLLALRDEETGAGLGEQEVHDQCMVSFQAGHEASAAGLLTRRSLQPIRLGGHEVAARTMLRVTPWVLHRDARWFPEPEAFRPERFPPGATPPPRGAYIPFGLGPRVCLGRHFAIPEMTGVAAMLLQQVRMSRPDDAPTPEPELHITLRPARPVRLTLARCGPAPALDHPLRAAA